MRSEAGKEKQAVNVYRLQADTPCRLVVGRWGAAGQTTRPCTARLNPGYCCQPGVRMRGSNLISVTAGHPRNSSHSENKKGQKEDRLDDGGFKSYLTARHPCKSPLHSENRKGHKEDSTYTMV